MGTTRVKLVDLSSDKAGVKTSRKHAAKIKPQIEEIKADQKPDAVEVIADNLPAETAPKTAKIAKKQTSKKHHLSRNYQQASLKIDKTKTYPAEEAIKILKETSFTKFDPTVEVHLNVIEKNLHGQVSFPHSIGPKKQKRYLVFSNKFKSANKNIITADEESVSLIEKGKLKPGRDFDVVIASPAFMPSLIKIAKVLGPSGMMPNPKNGTITDNPQSFIESKDSNADEFRSDPQAPIIHTKLGKLSASDTQIKDNLKALVVAVGPSKIRKATISATMSPGIKIDILTL